MPQLLGMLLLAALAIYALQLAIVVVIIAGFIFRPRQTLGFFLICGIITGFTAHPLIGVTMLAVLVAISLYFKNKEKKALPALAD